MQKVALSLKSIVAQAAPKSDTSQDKGVANSDIASLMGNMVRKVDKLESAQRQIPTPQQAVQPVIYQQPQQPNQAVQPVVYQHLQQPHQQQQPIFVNQVDPNAIHNQQNTNSTTGAQTQGSQGSQSNVTSQISQSNVTSQGSQPNVLIPDASQQNLASQMGPGGSLPSNAVLNPPFSQPNGGLSQGTKLYLL